MRRVALVVVVVGLAACGHDDKAKRTPVKEAGSKRSAIDRDLERVRKSKLPADAKRELEEAAKLLEEQR
jgi:hypothetical protein